MSLRAFLAVLIAVSLFFAPLAIGSGAAMAMAPGEHQSEMIKAGHCDQQTQKDQSDRQASSSCCIGMCTAIAIAPGLVAEPHAYSLSGPAPPADRYVHGFLAELPTPPPRLA